MNTYLSPCFSLRRLLALSVLATCATSSAQVVNWATATSGDWSDAVRWSPAAVPNGATYDVTIGAVGSAYTSTLNFVTLAGLLSDRRVDGFVYSRFHHDQVGFRERFLIEFAATGVDVPLV